MKIRHLKKKKLIEIIRTLFIYWNKIKKIILNKVNILNQFKLRK